MMAIVRWVRERLVYDYQIVSKWWSRKLLKFGALFTFVATSVSYASSGVAFEKWLNRLTLPFCFLLFVGTMIAQVWRQKRLHDSPEDDSDKDGMP
jgi:uncharacterized membrane protein YfcA